MTQAVTYQDLTGVHAHHSSRSHSESEAIDAFLHRPDWQLQAACRGQNTSWWFPDRGTPAPEAVAARKLCASCPVQTECLDQAVFGPHHEYGIWGNTSERQRKSLGRGQPRRSVRGAA